MEKNTKKVVKWTDDIKQDPFEEYIRQSEPSKRELGYAWYTAIGLQAVDGLETSDYLKDFLSCGKNKRLQYFKKRVGT